MRSLVLACVVAGFGLSAATAGAMTFTVNTTDDLNVACTAAHCSLREALDAANATSGQDVIAFSIGGGGPQTITPASPLPEATDPVVLDATTQPGYAGAPLIQIDGSAANGHGLVIRGGDSVVRGFVLNHFPLPYRAILVQGASGTLVEANYVGTDLAGAASADNGIGIEIFGSDDNVVGGTSPSQRNVVSGNVEDAVRIVGDPVSGATARNNVVQGNYIGLDASGTVAVHNKSGVVVVGAEGTLVGGTAAGARNVVSGNDFGIDVLGPATTVQGNYVGTNAAGNAAVGNAFGIHVIPDLATGTGGSDELIGGSAPGAGNVISGNAKGIQVQFTTASNRIQGNLIGVAADGLSPLGNSEDGIEIDRANETLVGGAGPGEGNAIRNSAPGYGVEVRDGVRNAILGNSFSGNTKPIRLTPYNPSDAGDGDSGANDGQNWPVLANASAGGGSTTVSGSLQSHASTTYRVEFYDCQSHDGFPAAEYVDVRDVTTNSSGVATFTFTLGEEVPSVAATATDPDGNTSEVSSCIPAQPAQPAAQVSLSPDSAVNAVGTTHTVTATVTSGEAAPQPLGGVIVRFSVQGAVTTSGTCTTTGSGTCTFSYAGPSTPGSDLISAYPDRNGNGVQDADELGDTATKSWVESASTPGQVTGGGQTTNFGGTDELAFGFTAKSDGATPKGSCSVEDRASATSIKCKDVTFLSVTGTHAVIRGNATINGVATTYAIQVDDLAESGAGSDRFTIETASGYSAGGVLTKGNIQIHG